MTVLLATVGSDVIIAHLVDSSRTGAIKFRGSEKWLTKKDQNYQQLMVITDQISLFYDAFRTCSPYLFHSLRCFFTLSLLLGNFFVLQPKDLSRWWCRTVLSSLGPVRGTGKHCWIHPLLNQPKVERWKMDGWMEGKIMNINCITDLLWWKIYSMCCIMLSMHCYKGRLTQDQSWITNQQGQKWLMFFLCFIFLPA